MGARQSKAAELVTKSVSSKLKTPAKTPISEKNIQNIARQKLEKAFVHQRQVEQEFERQQIKPKPAPIRTSVTGSVDRINLLSDDEKTKRKAEAEDFINDRQLFERLSKVSELTENIESYTFEGGRTTKNKNQDLFDKKVGVEGDLGGEENLGGAQKLSGENLNSDTDPNSDTNYNPKHKFHQKITGEQDYTQATYFKKEQIKTKGRVPSHEQINIISNNRQDPENWNSVEIAKLLNMRERDVSDILKYYKLIDDFEVDHIEPPNMEWSQENKCWMVGEPLPENPTLEDLKDNWNNRKPMISAGRLKKMKAMHKRADPKYNFGAVKALNEVYYIPPKVYDELLQPLKPEDKMFLTGDAISKDALGIGAGEVPLHEKIKQIEAMGEVVMPKIRESAKLSELGAGESEIKPMNEVTAMNAQPLTPEKEIVLENLKKQDEKPKSRFNDDASY